MEHIVRGMISFNTVYAAYQHERTDLHHDVGQAKYLEGPLKEFAPGLASFIATRVKAAVKAAGVIRSASALAEIQVKAAEDAIGAYAEIVGGAAQQIAPLEEGILRGSMEVSTGRVREVG